MNSSTLCVEVSVENAMQCNARSRNIIPTEQSTSNEESLFEDEDKTEKKSKIVNQAVILCGY